MVGLIGLGLQPIPETMLNVLKHRSEVVLVLTLSAIQRVSQLCMLIRGAAACLANPACPKTNACICAAVFLTWRSLGMQLTAEQPL